MNKYLKNVTATAFLVAASMQCAVAESSDIQLGLSLTGGYQFEGTPIKGYGNVQLGEKKGNFIFGVRPSVGVALTDNLSLSLGLILDYSAYEQKRINNNVAAGAQVGAANVVNNVYNTSFLNKRDLLERVIEKPFNMKMEDFKQTLGEKDDDFISALKTSKGSTIKVDNDTYKVNISRSTLEMLNANGFKLDKNSSADFQSEYKEALKAAFNFTECDSAGTKYTVDPTTFAVTKGSSGKTLADYQNDFNTAKSASDAASGDTSKKAAADKSQKELEAVKKESSWRPLASGIMGHRTKHTLAVAKDMGVKDNVLQSFLDACDPDKDAADILEIFTDYFAGRLATKEAITLKMKTTYDMERFSSGSKNKVSGSNNVGKSFDLSYEDIDILLTGGATHVNLSKNGLEALANFIENIDDNGQPDNDANAGAAAPTADLSLKVKDMRIGISPSIAYSLPISEDTNLGFALGFNVCHHSVTFDEISGNKSSQSKLKYFSFDPSLGVELKHKIGDLASIGVGLGVETNNFAKTCGENTEMEGSIGANTKAANATNVQKTKVQFGDQSVILNAKVSLYFAL